ncbi:MAG TPA: membrane protein insertion efficiency factor YidD [Candidatus Paceibacterota bacterium]|nr:membrane protein insertion efficiency factor YidD [Candidatus Paceibacterota bacterium]
MRKLAVGLIGLYQKWISPMFPPRCKYYPSCSSYAASAISIYGLKGLAMAVWRLVRCNPWSHGGVDYVPTKKVKTDVSQSHNNLHISGGATR